MSHEVETMAYRAAEKPWHGLGVPITSDMTTDQMVEIAGLGKRNESEQLYVERNGVYVPLDSLNRDNSKYRAIIRQDDGYIHNIMTDDYNVVQSWELVDFIREYLEAGSMSIETLGSLRHGSIIWALARIDKANFKLPGNDLNQTYFNISTSHDGSQETIGFFSNIREVCMNTHRMAHNAKKGRSFSIKHSAKMTDDVIKSAKLQVGLAVEATERYAEIATRMAETFVDTKQTLEFVAKLVQPKLLNVEDTAPKLLVANDAQQQAYIDSKDFTKVGRDILLAIAHGAGSQLESSKDTVWGLFNGVTAYVDHTAGRGRDSALTSAWYGAGAKLKDEAFKLATELVEARV